MMASAGADSLDYTPSATEGLYHPEPVATQPAEAPATKPFAEHFFVYQVSRNDDVSQWLPLNNASNTLAGYGGEEAYVEIVAYGPGLSMMLADSDQVDRIEDMAERGIQFSACANTMRAMGVTKDDLAPGVDVVTSGVVRINELQRAGFTYIRP